MACWILKIPEKISILHFLEWGKAEAKLPGTCWVIYTAHKEPSLCPECETNLNRARCQLQYIPIFPPLLSISTALCLSSTWSYPALWVLFLHKTGCFNICGPKESRKFGNKYKKTESEILPLNKISPTEHLTDVLGVKSVSNQPVHPSSLTLNKILAVLTNWVKGDSVFWLTHLRQLKKSEFQREGGGNV